MVKIHIILDVIDYVSLISLCNKAISEKQNCSSFETPVNLVLGC